MTSVKPTPSNEKYTITNRDGIVTGFRAQSYLDDDEKSSLEISEGTSPKGGNPNMTNLRISEVVPLLGLELMNDDKKIP